MARMNLTAARAEAKRRWGVDGAAAYIYGGERGNRRVVGCKVGVKTMGHSTYWKPVISVIGESTGDDWSWEEAFENADKSDSPINIRVDKPE